MTSLRIQRGAEAHPPATSEVIDGLIRKSACETTVTAMQGDAGILCLGWMMRARKLGMKTVTAAMTNANVLPGIHMNAMDIGEHMMIPDKPEGVIGMKHPLNVMTPEHPAQLYETGVMTNQLAVNPVDSTPSNMVRTMGKGPRGLMNR